jgi:hypothetical protein
MTIFTLPEIETQMAAYKAALMALSVNKEYTVDGKTITRSDLPEIRKTLDWLHIQKQELLSATGTKMQINRAYVGRG